MDETTVAIKQAVDIVDVIGEHVRLERFAGKFRGLCPFHDDHKPSFQVDPERQNYRCWACGAKGDLFSFVQEIERISFVEAKERLAERAGISLRKGGVERNDRKVSIYKVLNWAQEQFKFCLFDERMGAEARQYLLNRGLTLETIQNYGLGLAPANYEWLIQKAMRAAETNGTPPGETLDKLNAAGLAKRSERGNWYDVFRERVIFPIRDDRKRVVGFGGRILPSAKERPDGSTGPKYLNTPATDVYNKSEVLYGIEVAAEEIQRRPPPGQPKPARRIVVTEGYTDCLMCWQAGIKNVVATCGTALTPKHIPKLRSFADSVVLMFDGDAAGQKAARSSAGIFLSSELELQLCELPDDLDPCDFVAKFGGERMQEVIAGAKDALDFLISQSSKRHDVTRLEGQHQAVAEVLDVLAATPEMARSSQAIKYQLAVNRVADAFGVPETRLRQTIQELRSKRSRYQGDGGRENAGPPEIRVAQTPPGPFPPGDEGRFDAIVNGGGDPEDLSRTAEEPMVEPSSAIPMDPRERLVAGYLVMRPGRAGELMEAFPEDEVRHPILRRCVKTCYALFCRDGEHASFDDLREELNDPSWNRCLNDLREGVPDTDEEYEQGLSDIRTTLLRLRNRLAGEARRQLMTNSDLNEHLRLLRQSQNSN